MKSNSIVVAIFLNIMYVDNRMLPSPYFTLGTMETFLPEQKVPIKAEEKQNEKAIGPESNSRMVNADSEESFSYGKDILEPKDKCAFLVMSNQGHTTLRQSLMRKYRYNEDGDLIPSSVQYFIKLPKGEGSETLVPLKDKSFSPTGGFVRYYKEIPPIPQSWKR